MATERIYALFQDVADAERAIGALHDHGVSRDNIGVVTRRAAEQGEEARVRNDFQRQSDSENRRIGEPGIAYQQQPGTLPHATLAPTTLPTSGVDTVENVETVGKEGLTTTTPQDAAAGAAVGTGVGLVAGLLAAAAAIAIPGVGLVLGGGALMAALGATAATTAAGAVAGGAVGYLRDMGMPESAAQHAADRMHEGDYLITVDADTDAYDDIKQLLLKYNAVGVDDTVPLAAAQSAPSTSAPATSVAGSSFDLKEDQIVDPVFTEPHSVAPVPRSPANPALAQETEPMVEVS